MTGHVLALLQAGILRCCGGRGSTIVRGMRGRVSWPLRAGAWRC